MPRCAAFLDVLTWLAWCLCPAWGHLAFLRALLDGRICGVPAALSAKPYAAECAAGQMCLSPYGSCWVRAFIQDKRLRTCTCLWVRETMMIESLRLEQILRSSSPVVVLRDRFGGHLPFLKCFQRWWLHNFPEQPVLIPHDSFWEEIIPNISLNLPLCNLRPFSLVLLLVTRTCCSYGGTEYAAFASFCWRLAFLQEGL